MSGWPKQDFTGSVGRGFGRGAARSAVSAHLVAGRRTGAAATGAEATTRSAARGDGGSAA